MYRQCSTEQWHQHYGNEKCCGCFPDVGSTDWSHGWMRGDNRICFRGYHDRDQCERITEIGEGAEKNAAASEEVTASIQELNGMMQAVDQNSSELNTKIEELIGELTKFTV